MTKKATQEQKEDFYVFLDFDGVLYDLKYLAENAPSFKDIFTDDKKIFSYATDSIDALNKLFERLSSKYEPHLVISTFWRFLPTSLLVKSLVSSGLNTEGIEIHKTKITLHPHKRGLEVKDFLEHHDNSENFIIADDSYLENYLEFFPREKIVKTNIMNDRLVASKLDVPLAHYKLDPITPMMDNGDKLGSRTPDLHNNKNFQRLVANAPLDDLEMF